MVRTTAQPTRRDEAGDDRSRRGRSSPAVTTALVGGWLALIVAANLWGRAILARGIEIRILAPPIIGTYRWSTTWKVVIPIAVGVILVGLGPRYARRSGWRRLLLVAGVAAAVWAVALALVDGWYWLQRPMELPGHYWLDVSKVGSPGAFLSGFTDRIEEYGTHVRSHPPGFVLLLWLMDAVGLGGSGWAAVPAIVGGGLAVAGVLVAVREVADEDTARRAAPFLVVAPVALYVATTADAFYAAVGVWACTLVVLAGGRGGRRADALAFAGGLLLGLAGMLSYGLVLLLLLPVVVCVHRRRIRPLAVAAVGGLAVLVVFWSAGFNWVDGLETTRGEYAESVASVRPYGYFLLANLAALAVIIGPATVVGLVRLDDRRLWLLVGSGLAMVALADVSGMSKGEVERIWLPFAFWLLPAGAALWRPTARVSAVRGWLALQAGVAFLVQIGIRTHW